LWQYFDSEGFLVGEGDFKMGEGILKRYNNIGKLVQTREYRQSKAVGRSVYYNEKGEIIENVAAISE
jgi:antitoxin component YwqK of YwqJK toxin-antitoxin module